MLEQRTKNKEQRTKNKEYNTNLKLIFQQSLHLSPHTELDISFLGGMTNKNYLVLWENIKYVLRIPGGKTSYFINREDEANNSLQMANIGINVNTLFFDKISGIKITKYLDNSKTFNHQTIKLPDFLPKIAEQLQFIHHSQLYFHNEFNVFSEFNKYFDLLQNKNYFLNYHPEIPNLLKLFNYLSEKLNNRPKVPCHNDLVPENILLKEDKIHFIDWEYSGMNDPLFDIAAFFLESELNPQEQSLFLEYYFNNDIPQNANELILYYQFTQDILWFLWTLIKAEHNELFPGYAEKRLMRAIRLMIKAKQDYHL